MRTAGLMLALALTVALIACGDDKSTTSTNLANGTWTEALTSSSGLAEGSFTFSMMQNSFALSGTNMNFSNSPMLAACFGADTTMTGQIGMSSTGMMGGGSTMQMTMSGTPPGGTTPNTLVMSGTMGTNMGSASGTFTLTGNNPGCSSQTGTFTMTRL